MRFHAQSKRFQQLNFDIDLGTISCVETTFDNKILFIASKEGKLYSKVVREGDSLKPYPNIRESVSEGPYHIVQMKITSDNEFLFLLWNNNTVMQASIPSESIVKVYPEISLRIIGFNMVLWPDDKKLYVYERRGVFFDIDIRNQLVSGPKYKKHLIFFKKQVLSTPKIFL